MSIVELFICAVLLTALLVGFAAGVASGITAMVIPVIAIAFLLGMLGYHSSVMKKRR